MDDIHEEISPGLLPRIPKSIVNVLEHNLFPVSASLYRRENLLDLGGFDESLKAVEDWEILIRCIHKHKKIDALSERLVDYRITPNSLSKQVETMEENSLKMVDKIFSDYGLPEKIRTEHIRIRALRILDAAVSYLGSENTNCAVDRLINAFEIHPGLFDELNTHYAILCAKQPLAFRGSENRLELEEGLREAETLLQIIESKGYRLTCKHYASLYASAARLAYAQGRMHVSRHYWNKSVRRNLFRSLELGIIPYYLKSFLGNSRIKRVKRVLSRTK
jgi:hypothetical protein